MRSNRVGAVARKKSRINWNVLDVISMGFYWSLSTYWLNFRAQDLPLWRRATAQISISPELVLKKLFYSHVQVIGYFHSKSVQMWKIPPELLKIQKSHCF